MNVVRAEIGQWYFQPGSNEVFRVVGLDERSDTIEIQFLEGDLGELDAEVWSTLQLTRCPDPEDWTAPMDDVDTNDRYDLSGPSLPHRDVLASVAG